MPRHKLHSQGLTLIPEWLAVGHIDEVLSIRMQGTNVQAILASTQKGIDLLEANSAEVLETDWLSAAPGFPYTAPYTAQDVLSKWETYNENIQTNHLNKIKTDIESLGITVIEVPAYFAEVAVDRGDRALSMLPNMVNMLNVNGTLITLDPMFEHFKNELTNILGNVVWIDGLRIHRGWGGLHCASQTRREPHNAKKKWWKEWEQGQEE